jgi:hypothetical protein
MHEFNADDDDDDDATCNIQILTIPVVLLIDFKTLSVKSFKKALVFSLAYGNAKCCSTQWQHRRCLAKRVSFSGSRRRCLAHSLSCCPILQR